MSYVVFARKYRPQEFDEVVGQGHITTTLKNAINKKRVAHSYLFAGPRGVGKTTTARIFAKALNCENGPTPAPCNKCASCVEVTQGTSLDTLEIDAASNRGIDEVRNLRENVKFSPSKGRFKIYIIDEVHMLTPEAFNALLKTLEEPPAHVKFIFATTQPHKVPPTILSRCQRFDFKRIGGGDIIEILRSIVQKERLKVHDEAFALIARYSDGSARDAEVMLDQLASFGRGEIASTDVVAMLGVVDEEVLFGLAESVARKDAPAALKRIDGLINDGKDVVQLITSLIGHFRNLAAVKVSEDLDAIIDASPESLSRLKGQARLFTIHDILYAIYALSNTIDFVRKTTIARIPLEACVVRLCQKPGIASLDDILKRVGRLEEGLAGSRPPRRETPPEASLRETPRREAPGLEISREAPRRESGQQAPKPQEEGAPAAPEAPKLEEALPPEAPAQEAAGSKDAALLDMAKSRWQAILNLISSKKMSVASYLLEGTVAGVESGKLLIALPREHQFQKEVLEEMANRHVIEEVLKEALKADIRVTFTVSGDMKASNVVIKADEAPAARPDSAPRGPSEIKRIVSEPIVKSAIDIFNAEIRGIRQRYDKERAA